MFVDFLLVLVAVYANAPSSSPEASTFLAIIGSEKYHMVFLLWRVVVKKLSYFLNDRIRKKKKVNPNWSSLSLKILIESIAKTVPSYFMGVFLILFQIVLVLVIWMPSISLCLVSKVGNS